MVFRGLSHSNYFWSAHGELGPVPHGGRGRQVIIIKISLLLALLHKTLCLAHCMHQLISFFHQLLLEMSNRGLRKVKALAQVHTIPALQECMSQDVSQTLMRKIAHDFALCKSSF